VLLVVNVRIKKTFRENRDSVLSENQSTCHKASKLWNELPDRLKSITKLATFKKQLKALLANDEGTYFNL